MGKDKTQTTTQTVDPASQGHIDAMRRAGMEASQQFLNQPGSFFQGADTRSISQQIAPFMNPYMDQVLGGLGDKFAHLRKQASTSASQGASAHGAFNSARHGVLEAERLSGLDRAETETVGGLLSNQFNTAVNQGLQYSEYQRALKERQLQEPIFRHRLNMEALGNTLGPYGTTTEQVQEGDLLRDISGLVLMAAGAKTKNPGLVTAGAEQTQGSQFAPVSSSQNPAFTRPLFGVPTSTLPYDGKGMGIRQNQPGLHPWWNR